MKFLLAALGFVTPLAIANVAHAGLEACGNIHVEAEAECTVEGGVTCEGMCTPLAVEAQCAADLTIECRGQCEGELSASAECTGSCEGSCVAECEVEPAEFNCRAQCNADCQGRAEGRCGTGDSECFAQAEASCEAECSGVCEVEPGTADCEAECQGSCQASCEASATAYLDCQAECQGPSFGECTAEVEGGCEVACESEEGAIFCDGSYVDHDGNLQECVSSIEAWIRARVEINYGGEASCSGNECEASGFINCSCTTDPDHLGRDTAILTLAGLFLFGVARRRRRAA
jgi:MYXO-CTERM domain-containing protein